MEARSRRRCAVQVRPPAIRGALRAFSHARSPSAWPALNAHAKAPRPHTPNASHTTTLLAHLCTQTCTCFTPQQHSTLPLSSTPEQHLQLCSNSSSSSSVSGDVSASNNSGFAGILQCLALAAFTSLHAAALAFQLQLSRQRRAGPLCFSSAAVAVALLSLQTYVSPLSQPC